MWISFLNPSANTNAPNPELLTLDITLVVVSQYIVRLEVRGATTASRKCR
jgi:hypothetical protein